MFNTCFSTPSKLIGSPNIIKVAQNLVKGNRKISLKLPIEKLPNIPIIKSITGKEARVTIRNVFKAFILDFQMP